MRSILFTTLCVSLLLAGFGCRPLYRAGVPNQPIMKEKQTLDMEVGLETGTGYFNASYSLTDHFFVTAGGNAWSSNHTSAQFGEFGLGVYSFNKEQEFGYSLTATTGFGNSNVIQREFVDDPLFGWGNELLIEYASQFARFAVQPGIYWQDEMTDISFAVRTSGLYWLAPNRYDGQETEGLDIYAEPVVSVRSGTSVTKFFIDLGLQIPISRQFTHPINPIHLGAGMNFVISKRSLSGARTGKTNEQ